MNATEKGGKTITITLTETTFNDLLAVQSHMRGELDITAVAVKCLEDGTTNKLNRYEKNAKAWVQTKADRQLLAQLRREGKI